MHLLPSLLHFPPAHPRYYSTMDAMPHLVNLGKYVTSMLITTFSYLANSYDKASSTATHRYDAAAMLVEAYSHNSSTPLTDIQHAVAVAAVTRAEVG